MNFQNAKLKLCRHGPILQRYSTVLNTLICAQLLELVSVLQAHFKHNVLQFAQYFIWLLIR
jgi:hypothetical protein